MISGVDLCLLDHRLTTPAPLEFGYSLGNRSAPPQNDHKGRSWATKRRHHRRRHHTGYFPVSASAATAAQLEVTKVNM